MAAVFVWAWQRACEDAHTRISVGEVGAAGGQREDCHFQEATSAPLLSQRSSGLVLCFISPSLLFLDLLNPHP